MMMVVGSASAATTAATAAASTATFTCLLYGLLRLAHDFVDHFPRLEVEWGERDVAEHDLE